MVTAEPEDMFEKATHMRLTAHQEYTRCREPCKTGLETELGGQSTSKSDYTRQNLQQVA
jgi:hypothetical protein